MRSLVDNAPQNTTGVEREWEVGVVSEKLESRVKAPCSCTTAAQLLAATVRGVGVESSANGDGTRTLFAGLT